MYVCALQLQCDVCVMCPDYTDLSVGTVTQVQAVPYTGPISLLVSQLRSLTGQFTIMHQSHESACPCSWGDLLITCVCVFRRRGAGGGSVKDHHPDLEEHHSGP